MAELPIAAVDRIIRRVGGQRVGESAARELAEVLEEKGMEIAGEATTLAEHAGRKTVRDEDIRLAMRKRG
ncbi:histone [candidate division MSBL1 archaeon SCGC-AAA259I09]|uniref:Histone n=1 Tax=candidate division MSBL1 archaeon SCGC-AAA259I09 TaxID=1698267 RepID=A0A133UNB9_9EURY|nr:histone [candidate division MSBL1 archaeon SCGC-AAA259I09]